MGPFPSAQARDAVVILGVRYRAATGISPKRWMERR